jgi:hypothetical protein
MASNSIKTTKNFLIIISEFMFNNLMDFCGQIYGKEIIMDINQRRFSKRLSFGSSFLLYYKEVDLILIKF